MSYYANVYLDESRALSLYDKDRDYDVILTVASTLDYTRFTIRVLGTRSTLEADVLVPYDCLNDLIQSLEEGGVDDAFICDDYVGNDTRLIAGFDESGNLTLRIEVVKDQDLSITLSPASVSELVEALRSQIEAVEARPRIEKTYAEWQRIARANDDRKRHYYAEIIREQIEHRGFLDNDLVVCVFADEDDVEYIFEVCTVELSATVATWQRTAEYLRSDRSESLALAVEEAVADYIYGASPVNQVELSFDWNDAPGIEDALWRVALLGDYAEATKPFVSLVAVR